MFAEGTVHPQSSILEVARPDCFELAYLEKLALRYTLTQKQCHIESRLRNSPCSCAGSTREFWAQGVRLGCSS